MFKARSLVTAVFVLVVLAGESFAKDDRWFFTADEIADAYRYQQQFGARLRQPIEPQICFEGKSDFAASAEGRQFVAPCRFVDETIRQLRELLESGAAKYLFPLDVDAADLAVPTKVYESQYKQLRREEVLPALLREPTLVAIYHTAVHLDPEAGDNGSRMKLWGKNRTIIGFYDGRTNQVLPSPSDGGVDYRAGRAGSTGQFRDDGPFFGRTIVCGE